MDILEKYALNTNWGVPVEIKALISEDIRKLKNKSEDTGIWVTIAEFAAIPEAEPFVIEVIKKMKFRYIQCLNLLEEVRYNSDILRPIVEKIFNPNSEQNIMKGDEK